MSPLLGIWAQGFAHHIQFPLSKTFRHPFDPWILPPLHAENNFIKFVGAGPFMLRLEQPLFRFISNFYNLHLLQNIVMATKQPQQETSVKTNFRFILLVYYISCLQNRYLFTEATNSNSSFTVPSSCESNLECNKLPQICVDCNFNQSCVYGDDITVNCTVKPQVSCLVSWIISSSQHIQILMNSKVSSINRKGDTTSLVHILFNQKETIL